MGTIIAPEGPDGFPGKFQGRLSNTQVLSVGALGTVYKAYDVSQGRTCVVKVYDRGQPAIMANYTEHLQTLSSLIGDPRCNLLLPYEAGQDDGVFYQMFDYVPSVRSLAEIIREHILTVNQALDLLQQVAEGLQYLHSHGVIHADIKPENILIKSGPKQTALIIDFGMIEYADSGESILYIGTYKYMHPSLRGKRYNVSTDATTSFYLKGLVGSYVDIYALGVVAYIMLTGDDDLPHPLSFVSITESLKRANTLLSGATSSLIEHLSQLLLKMLTVGPSGDGINAESVSCTCRSLKKMAANELPTPVPTEETISHCSIEQRSESDRTTTGIIAQLEKMGRDIDSVTTVMLRTPERIESLTELGKDTFEFTEMKTAISNALQRIRASWFITVAMTCCVFALIIVLVVAAIMLVSLKGKEGWSLFFGGTSVCAIIGLVLLPTVWVVNGRGRRLGV